MTDRSLRQKRAERLMLEESAVNPAWEEPASTHDGVTCPGAAPDELQTSVAISLKRIADMLDGTTLGLNCAETIFNPATTQNREVRNTY